MYLAATLNMIKPSRIERELLKLVTQIWAIRLARKLYFDDLALPQTGIHLGRADNGLLFCTRARIRQPGYPVNQNCLKLPPFILIDIGQPWSFTEAIQLVISYALDLGCL